jgi:2-polyprenyl-3-methyl-5-hydroxy-6-metoxy-1,4-benzoquinol methylase
LNGFLLMKNKILHFLRYAGLLMAFDKSMFHLSKWRNYTANQRFLATHPEIELPSDYLMYESFQLNYEQYYHRSRSAAAELLQCFARYFPESGELRVLDWGCGPGRIIRHMPALAPSNYCFFGTDYNAASIAWCSKAIPEVSFALNTVEPPTSFDTESFNVIYGISILTHLPERLHTKWYEELFRLLKPGGILYLTTQGKAFRQKLLSGEVAAFDRGELVVRGLVKEGHRTFSAFQPAAYMRHLFEKALILEHVEGIVSNGKPQQDVWIVQKKIS